NEAKDFKAGDFPGIFGCLALCIIEVGWHGDHCTVDWLAEKRFRPIFQFAQNEGGNFRWSKNFFAQPNPNDIAAGWIETKRKKFQFVLNILHTATHQAFDG